MCGRGRLIVDYQTLKYDQIEEACKTLPQIENFAPGNTSNILIKSDSKIKLITAKWGLIPNYTKEEITTSSFFKRFNARCENLEKIYSKLLPNNRCVIPFAGFYEWKKEGKSKQAYYVKTSSNDEILYLAGIFDEKPDKNLENDHLRTYSIVTTESVSKFKTIHDRVPVVLKEEDINKWIFGKYSEASELIKDKDLLSWHPVTNQVGKLSFQEETCSKEIKILSMKESISKMFKNVKPVIKPEIKAPSKRKQDAEDDEIVIIGSSNKREKLETKIKHVC